MTQEQFASQVETMMANLEAVKSMRLPNAGAAYAFDQHDYPLAVCECAALFSGNDTTFAKMFNRSFRNDACSMMFEQALQAVAA